MDSRTQVPPWHANPAPQVEPGPQTQFSAPAEQEGAQAGISAVQGWQIPWLQTRSPEQWEAWPQAQPRSPAGQPASGTLVAGGQPLITAAVEDSNSTTQRVRMEAFATAA